MLVCIVVVYGISRLVRRDIGRRWRGLGEGGNVGG